MWKVLFFLIIACSSVFSVSIEDIRQVQKKLQDPRTWSKFNKYYKPPKFLKPIILDEQNPKYPSLNKEVFNTSIDDKDRCIISYASINLNYPGSLRVISDCLKKIGYKGHFLYRIGGWPNMEFDGFDLTEVPYGFKIKAIQEAERLGYRNILWIDSSMRPVKCLDSIFETIEKKGMFFNLNHTFKRLNSISKETLSALGVTYAELEKTRYVNTGVIGFNFKKRITREFFDQFYALARKKISFFNGYFEELPFSVLISRMNLTGLAQKTKIPLFQYISLKDTFKIDCYENYRAIFMIDYGFSKKWHP